MSTERLTNPNDKDYRYWVVEFPSHTKVLHYEDLEITFERSHQ